MGSAPITNYTSNDQRGVLKTLIVQEWKVIVEDRVEWMDVTVAAKILRRLYLLY